MIGAGAIGRAVEDYLAERQRLGYRMHDSELRRFARYADQRSHAGPLDAELQITWARLHVVRTTAGTGTRRLETLRPFVRYYRQFEPGSAEVDPCLLGPKRGRPTPHIYTPDEIGCRPLEIPALDRLMVIDRPNFNYWRRTHRELTW